MNSQGEINQDLMLSGDLNQMATQRIFLKRRGLNLNQVDVYPVVNKDDVIQALTMIWVDSIEGWWHYKDEYIKYDICTEDQFKAKLHGLRSQ
jgi:hypothetical protein